MEPSSSSDTEYADIVLQELRKRLAGNDSLSIFKVPRVRDAVSANKSPAQDTRVSGGMREFHRPTPEQQQQCGEEEANEAGSSGNTTYENEDMTKAVSKRAPKPTGKGYFREISALSVATTTQQLFPSPSTSRVTQLQENVMQGAPILSRILGGYHSPFSVQSSGPADGGHSDKRHTYSSHQHCQPRFEQDITRQYQPDNEVIQSLRCTRRGKGGLNQPSHAVTSVLKKEFRLPKKTRLSILLPAMPHATEKQLISIFFELSKLHGCDISMDENGYTLNNEVKIKVPPVGRFPAATQQTTPAGRVNQRDSQHFDHRESVHPAGRTSRRHSLHPASARRKRPTTSRHQTFLRTLQSRLQALGTQLQVIEVPQESPGGISDFDDPLLLYPEVVMDCSPTD